MYIINKIYEMIQLGILNVIKRMILKKNSMYMKYHQKKYINKCVFGGGHEVLFHSCCE